MMEEVIAKAKFATMMYTMFGGLPLSLVAVIFKLRDQLKLQHVSSAVVLYYMMSKYLESPLGHDSQAWRKMGNWFMGDLQRFNGGGVLPPKQDFDKTKKYILAGAPHGVVAFTWGLPFFHYNYGPEQKPSITLGARFLFQMPVMRDFVLMSAVEGSNENADAILNAERSLNVIPGGVPEMIECLGPGKRQRVYCKNKGFIRLALRHGTDIIPIFAFGEQNQYTQKSFFEEFFQKRLGGMYPMVPWGGKLCGVPLGPFLPNDEKLVHAFGMPVAIPKIESPTQEQVDFYHMKFYQALHDLVMERCEEAGFPDVEVEFIGLEQLNIRVAPSIKHKEQPKTQQEQPVKVEEAALPQQPKKTKKNSKRGSMFASFMGGQRNRGGEMVHMARL